MSSDLPTLPSIHLMLKGASISPTTKHHRRHASDVVGHFKNLTLSTPTPVEPYALPNPSTTDNISWPAPFQPLYQHHHSPRSARNLHSRSYSDYTHPYATTPPALLAAPQQHRRAVSASTVETMMQPPALHPSHSSTSTSPSSPTLSTKTPSDGEDDAPSGNNRYKCPYCEKGFSRPSSLRIHTYSHTGEKPFQCPEPNCDRFFSVQSNMRRHIRVHKLNGKHLKMRKTPPPIKPLAAKPSWMLDTTLH